MIIKIGVIKGGSVSFIARLHEWEERKITYYHRQQELTIVRKLILCLGIAALTGVSAQIRIPLPFTPVPITGQVLVVLLAGITLGSRYSGLSMLLYLALGAVGLPWFANFSSGIPIGPSAGYIYGFVPAALLIGWLAARYSGKMSSLILAVIMLLGVGVIYLCGAVNFALYMKTDIVRTLYCAVIPFIPVDIVKAFIAAGVARLILPVKLT